jgi:hypothetical protein
VIVGLGVKDGVMLAVWVIVGVTVRVAGGGLVKGGLVAIVAVTSASDWLGNWQAARLSKRQAASQQRCSIRG